MKQYEKDLLFILAAMMLLCACASKTEAEKFADNLPPYKSAIQAGAGSVMTSFNDFDTTLESGFVVK